jgi:hypothetical protein
MGFIDLVTRPMDWFAQSAPAPVKILLSLAILLLFGNLLASLFFTGNYVCDEGGLLVDNRVFEQCITPYTAGMYYKWNLSVTECQMMPQASDPEWNRTVCTELMPKVQTTSWILTLSTGFTSIPDRFWSWLTGANTSSRASLLTYLSDPSSALCNELYTCLTPELRTQLNVTETCKINKGIDDVSDHFPNLGNYSYYTRLGRTYESQSVDKFEVFGVQCYDFGQDQSNTMSNLKGSYSPEVAFFGIPFLRYELWLILIIVGFFIWLISKL